MSTQLEELRLRYIAEQPRYETLARAVRERLESEARSRGLKVQFDHRAKDVPSLVKKALVYGKQYEEITDKAGARVVYQYEWQGSLLEEIIRGVFVVLKREDKVAEMQPDRLGYLGIHYDVRFRDDDERAPRIELGNPTCEVQLHTRQQNVWAAYSHELLYKVAQLQVPGDVRRGLYRLLALVEIFDREVNMSRDAILTQPGYAVARVLERLEREFYRLTARDYDGELSKRLLEAILPLYEEDPQRELERFLADRGTKVNRIYEQYRDDHRAAPLLFQPEALLIFERLERTPALLDEVFSAIAPRELLADLSVVWGTPLDEE